ncbi:MAG: hypothetical protein J6Y28_00055 [Acholeplasmatales bacterium]|nr:hypothetical protein [Acholeplasmatales bacterium]
MKKILTLLIVLSIILLGLTACGNNNETTTINNPVSENTTTKNNDNTTSTKDSINDVTTTITEEDDATKIIRYKEAALSKLDELVNPVIAKIQNNELRSSIQTYYNTETRYINDINDLETAKSVLNKVINDTNDFALNTLKPLAVEKLNSVVNPLINRISHAELKSSVQTFYNTEMEKVSSVQSLDDIADLYKEIIDDTNDFITQETSKIVIALKNEALEELDPYVTTLISKIPYDTLKTDTQAFYNTEKEKLEDVDTIEGVNPCVEEIKNDLETYALTEAKKIAVSKLEEVVDAGLDKIPNEDIKSDLTSFSETEIAKLNAITNIENVPSTLETVIQETESHIKELLGNIVKDYLSRLTQVEEATAYDYLPPAMSPTYSANIVTESSITYDFTSFVNVSSINQAGFGEQWQMVVENINQSVEMAKVFNIVQTALGAATNAVDIYITNSYADEMNYQFEGNDYNGLSAYANGILIFNINITTSVNVPIAGSIKPTIKMAYDLTNDSKETYISLGDSFKIKYVISDNSYEMATTYGITLFGHNGSRSSYLSITKEDEKTVGHIYEYTTLDGSDKIQACADFYIENGYVSVVGNKSSGMTGFDGYINELYLANSGRLLGYEVREQLTIAGVSGKYNTIWFNIWDIQGINNVKVTDKSKDNKSDRSTVDVYLNNSETLFSPTYNKLIIKTSRKYDIEFRTRYYYTYDSTNETYVANAVNVPMFFIQEGDNFDSFTTDMLADNSITASVSLNKTYLDKILADYSTLIDIFIRNKDLMSSEQIIAYLNRNE